MANINSGMTFIVYNKDNEIMYRDYISIYNFASAFEEYKIPEGAAYVRIQFSTEHERFGNEFSETEEDECNCEHCAPIEKVNKETPPSA